MSIPMPTVAQPNRASLRKGRLFGRRRRHPWSHTPHRLSMVDESDAIAAGHSESTWTVTSAAIGRVHLKEER